MFDLGIVLSSVLNGLTMGAVYTLIALGLTLIYGVLHIINFAHGAALMMALFAVYGLNQVFGLDPYLSMGIVVPGMFVFGYALQRFVIERASHERDENILLVTLGVSIVMENLALLLFHSDTRSIDTDYTLSTVTILGSVLARAKVISFLGAMVVSGLLLVLIQKTDLGRAIRAVAKEKQGARLMGINVEHVYAMSFGIGMASLGAAAAFLLPSFYVNPTVGNGFVLVAFTIVVLALLITAFLRHSRFGAYLQAVRDNEDAARALGVNPFAVKCGATMLSAGLMGAGGAFYLQVFQYIDPNLVFGSHTSIAALVGAIVGGMGTLWGPVVGAMALELLSELTRNLFGELPGINLVIYGALLILIMVFLPRGLVGLKDRVQSKSQRARQPLGLAPRSGVDMSAHPTAGDGPVAATPARGGHSDAA